MLLRLEDALSEPLSWQEDLEIPSSDFERGDLIDLSPIRTSGELRHIEDGYLLSGRVAYTQTLACSRCLDPAKESIDTDFQVVLVESEGTEADAERELELDDLNIALIRGEEVDTRDFALEQVVLNLPNKPLCQEDCAGLCPQCGERRDSRQCSCEPATDPRWGALAALRGEVPGSKNGS